MISFKDIYLKSLPLFLTGSAALFASWIDTVVASYFGAPAVAAVGICSMIFFVLFSFSNGFSIAIQSFTASFLTSRKHGEVLDVFVLCLFMGLLLSLLLTGITLYYTEDLLNLISPDKAVVEASRQYLEFLLYAVPFYYAAGSNRGLLIALGRTWIVARIGVAVQVINAIATFILTFGMLGAPELGIRGIGLGTLIGFSSGAVLYASVALATIRQQHLKIGMLTLPLVADILKKSILSASQVTIYAFGLLLSFWIVGHLSVLAVAVYQVISQIARLPMYLSNALGMVALNQVGRATGAKDYSGARLIGLKVIKGSVYPIVGYALLVMVFSAEVLLLLLEETLGDPQLLTVFALSCLILPINIAGGVANFVLQGAQLFGRVWAVSAITQWGIFLPLAYLFGVFYGFGLAGVIFADLIYRCSLLALQLSYWKSYTPAVVA